MPFDWLFFDEEGDVLWWRAILVAGVILMIDLITMVVGPPRVVMDASTQSATNDVLSLAFALFPLVLIVSILFYINPGVRGRSS